LRRVLAVAVGVAMVPALYAVATATTGGGGASSTVSAASRSADDVGTETEVEHGAVVEKPHRDAATPSLPEANSPTTVTAPEATIPTTPDQEVEQEVEHAVPEPGDDNGVDAGNDDRADAPVTVPPSTQSFSSAGGSITVSTDGSTVALVSSSPATGFAVEVHDNGPDRVEVHFTNGDLEWRI